MKNDDVLHFVKDKGIDFVRVGLVTPTGEIRSASIPQKKLKEVLEGGMSIHPFSLDQNTTEPRNSIVLPDPVSFRETPLYSSGEHGVRTAMMLGDVHNWDGSPSKLCSRTALKNALKGIPGQAIVGTETEWFYRNPDGSLPPINGDIHYFKDDLIDPMTFTRLATAKNLDEMGIPVAKTEKDSGTTSHEISLVHTDALTAADNLLMARGVIRDTARKHNLIADLSPKARLDDWGTALHFNMSLQNGGKNVFNNNGQLSAEAIRFGEGILNNAALLNFFLNSRRDSYDRFDPRFYVGTATTMGPSSFNMIRTFEGNEDLTRLEIRNPDNHTNPHLGLTALLTAGIGGMRGQPTDGKYRHFVKSIDEATALVESIIQSGQSHLLGVPAELLNVLVAKNRKESIKEN